MCPKSSNPRSEFLEIAAEMNIVCSCQAACMDKLKMDEENGNEEAKADGQEDAGWRKVP